MAEVQPRSSGHRGRGGRGGYSSRGGRPRQTNGDKAEATPTVAYEDEGELGQLKKQYSSKLSTIKEMFPDWTDDDIVFALQENGGDLERTIERITEGNTTQWGEVKKKTKDRARSKVKDPASDGIESTTSARGGRGRAADGQRGGRGRASDRGRGTGRGRGGGPSGTRKPANSEPAAGVTVSTSAEGSWDTPQDTTGESWDQSNQGGTTSPDASWEMVTPSEAAPPPQPPVTETMKPSLRPDGTRSWASMLKPSPKRKVTPISKSTDDTPSQSAPPPEIPPTDDAAFEQPEATTSTFEETTPREVEVPASPSLPPSEPIVDLTPSKDQLTESNLEQVPDVSEHIATATAASTIGTNDPRSITGIATPVHASQQPPSAVRPVLGGFATSALKATTSAGRSASFQRRVKEQQEAVVMPGNHAVDRAAVQFGSMGLGGSNDDLDVDEEREEAETRTQPPQHSPIAPKASLPPVPQQPVTDPLPTTRPAPGLPPASQQPSQTAQPEQQTSQQLGQSGYAFNQFNSLYGAPGSQAESTTPATKAYEPFGQQAPQQSGGQQPFDGYPAHSQTPSQQSQAAHQSQIGGFSSSANDYSSYYTSDSQRNAYHNLYGSFGQQSQTPQDAGTTQQRGASAFGTTGADHPSSQASSHTQQPQSRFGATSETQNSGHSTPNPTIGQQSHGQTQTHQNHQMGQAHGQGASHHGGYPYGGPSYYSPYYAQYMNQVSHQYGRDRPMYDDVRRLDEQYLTHNNQFGYGASQGGYGSGPYGAGGKYGQPHQGYGMSPPSSYDHHSASPANVGGYGQQPHSIPGRDSSSALGAYGRTGSTQPTEGQPQHGSGTFGGMPDVFGRSQSGYSAQSSQQQTGQQSGSDDPSRGFGDASKATSGPSPVPGQAGVRPGSAANNAQSQGGFASSQGQGQQGYNGYPAQMSHQMHGQQSHYGAGLGGLGQHQSGAQNHQNSGYGGAYGAGFGGNYYNNSSRGGWSGSYGH